MWTHNWKVSLFHLNHLKGYIRFCKYQPKICSQAILQFYEVTVEKINLLLAMYGNEKTPGVIMRYGRECPIHFMRTVLSKTHKPA